MAKLIDLTGQIFGSLKVERRSGERNLFGALWVCSCSCGVVKDVFSQHLRSGEAKSCGCKRNDGHAHFKHGHAASKNRTYKSWREMRQRCMNPANSNWQWYGGRGIKVCAEWDSYEVFLADMGERPNGTTIDRLDSDGNYEKSNCRWATPKQQAETNRGIFVNGMAPANRTSDTDLKKMREMRAAGMKLKEIASHFGKGVPVISGLINHGPRGAR